MADFKINYKGTSCQGTTYDYKCTECGMLHQEQHPAKDTPKIHCLGAHCDGECKKVITTFALDADHHDSMRSYNIGWETE